MHKWLARFRIDTEEVFTTDTQTYHLDTTVLSEAAAYIEHDLGGCVTLISLERDV